MAKFRVEYNRNGCIGADICTFVDSARFTMGDDNKANMHGGKEEKPGIFVMETDEPCEDMGNDLRRAADSCPAGVIRIFKSETGERIAGHPVESEKAEEEGKKKFHENKG